MKRLIIVSIFIFASLSSYSGAETLKRYATVCKTKGQLAEITENRNDKSYVIAMLQTGKCKMLLSDAVVPI